MSRYTTVKVWQLTPEQIANYKPGMDLGEPDRIEKVKLVTFPDFDLLPEQKNGRGRGIRIKGRMTSRDYEMQRRRGLNDVQIADLYGIKLDTLQFYKGTW